MKHKTLSSSKAILQALILVMVLLGSSYPANVQAQTGSSEWGTPINLSNSGATSQPNVVLDFNQTYHVFWQDAYAGIVHTQGDGTTWETPVNLDLPFSGLKYRLIATPDGLIYAFWIDDEYDFYYSSVPANLISSMDQWAAPVRLAVSVVAYDVRLDSKGQLHLGYIRALDTNDFPAGVYYIRTYPGTSGWSFPRLIDQSRYFRTLIPPPDQSAARSMAANFDVSIDVEATLVEENNWIFIAWENPALKRIYYTRSVDEGGNWSETTQVDGPNSSSAYQTPKKLIIHANGSNVVFLWQSTDPVGGSCIQRYRSSQDGGDTFQANGNLWQEFNTCPQDIHFYSVDSKTSFLFANIQGQPFLQAWNGEIWSDIQNQNALDGFFDPNTLNVVEFRCYQPIFNGKQLLIIGCDTGRGGDIWAVSREVDSLTDWFMPKAAWSAPLTTNLGDLTVTSLVIQPDMQDGLHVLWSELKGPNAIVSENGISYAFWKGSSFSGPYPIITAKLGIPDQLAAAVQPSTNRLVALWQAGELGQIYSSYTSPEQAGNRSNWIEPKTIQPENTPGLSPVMVLSTDGTLYALYGIPLNENRGLYLTKSQDGGTSWTEAEKILDGTTLNCPMVENPSIAINGSQTINILWTCATLPGGAGSLTLYGLRSIDAGITWDAPEQISAQPTIWNQVIAYGGQTVHRFWKEVQPGETSLFTSISQDGGLTWSQPNKFIALEGEVGETALTIDRAGQLHLLQASQQRGSKVKIDYLVGNGARWESGPEIMSAVSSIKDLGVLSVAIDPTGKMLAAFTSKAASSTDQGDQTQISFTALQIDVPQVSIPESSPAVLPTNTPTASQTLATPQPELTPTAIAANFNRTRNGSNSSPVVGIVVGVFLAVALTTGTFVYSKVVKKSNLD